MAVTITNVKKISLGNARMTTFSVTGPASYTSGGETLTVAQQRQIAPETCGATVDFSKIKFFGSEVNALATNATALYYALDKTNNKLLAYKGKSTADEVGAVDLSTAASVTTCFVIYDVANG